MNDDPYVYPGTGTLINVYGERNREVLEQLERATSRFAMRQALPQFNMTPAGYQAAHHHLFSRLYPWAGEFRAVDMAKGNDMFCKPQFIVSQLDQCFRNIMRDDRVTTYHDPRFHQGLAEHAIELLAVHPFRDGNGRSTRLIMFQIAERTGHEFAIPKLDVGAWNQASIVGFRTLDAAPMATVIEQATTRRSNDGQAKKQSRSRDRDGGRDR